MHQQGVSRALHSRGTFNLHFQLPVSYDVERLHLQVYPGLWSKPALTKTKTRAKLKGKISKCFFFCRVDAQSISASSKRDQASVFHGSFLATHLLAWKALRIVCFLAAGHPPSWFWVGWWVESQGSDRVQNDYLGWDQEFSVLFPLSRVSTWTISDGPGAAFVSDFSFSHC